MTSIIVQVDNHDLNARYDMQVRVRFDVKEALEELTRLKLIESVGLRERTAVRAHCIHA